MARNREIVELQLPSGEIVDFDVPSDLSDAEIQQRAVAAGLFEPEAAPEPPPAQGAGDVPAQAPPPEQDVPAAPTLGERFMRQQELGVRAVARGAVGVIGDAVNQALNVIPGVNLALPSQVVDEQLTKLGVATPDTAGERVAGSVVEFGAGAISGIGGATALPARLAAKLQENAAAQVAGGVAAGGAVGTAQEQGVGPWGQLVIGLVGGVGGAISADRSIAKYGNFFDKRMETGAPVTTRELAEVNKAGGVDLEPAQLEQLAEAVNGLSAASKVEAATIDLIHNPKTAMSITDGANGKKRVLTGEEKEIRREIRKAFAEDGDMADFMARTAAERDADRSIRAEAIRTEGIERVRAREALQRRDPITPAPSSIDTVRQEQLAARQDAMLARLEQKAIDAENPQTAALRENSAERNAKQNAEIDTLGANPRTVRNAEGKVRATQTFGNKLIKRVDQISPRLAVAMRKVDVVASRRTNAAIQDMGDWLENPAITRAFEKSPTFRTAVMNLDRVKMDRVVPGSAEIYDRVVAPRLMAQGQALRTQGIETLEDFHPREVRDIAKVRKALGREQRGELTLALAKAKSDKGGQDLKEDEIAAVIGRFIGGRPIKQDRTRRIKEVTEASERFYVNPRSALIDNVSSFERDIQTQQFFKQTLGEDVALRGVLPNGQVGRVLARSMESGDLSADDIQEAARLVSIAFGVGRQGPSGVVRTAKNAITLSTLGFNPFASITQLGDPFINVARFGSDSLKQFIPGKGGQFAADAYNAGVRELSSEARTPEGLARVVRRGLKAAGFEQLDRKFSKQGTKAAFSRRQKQANKNPEKFEKDMTELFGAQDAARLTDDIRANRMSDDIASLVANDVADVRPLSNLDLPVSYSKFPNGRLAFSLLSWSINQLNFVRNNALNIMEQGAKTGSTKMIAKGAKTLALMTALFAAGGGVSSTGKDLIRTTLSGEPFDPVESFEKGAIAGAVPFGMTGKFAIEGLLQGRGSVLSAIPAAGLGEQALRGITKFLTTGEPEQLMKATTMGRNLFDLMSGVNLISAAEASTDKVAKADAKGLEAFTQSPEEAELVAGLDKATQDQLALREGNRSETYKDSTGSLAAGIGHTLTKAEQIKYPFGTMVPQEVRDAWFEKDAAVALRASELQAKVLGEPRLIPALISVNFQLGTSWFKEHKKTWKLLKAGEWDKAATEAANSKWNRQTPVRVEDFQKVLRNL